MAIPRRAIIAVTSYNEPFYADGEKTGLFYTEALHPYNELVSKGFEVDFVSETGTYGIDSHSISDMFMDAQDMKEYNDKEFAMNQKLAHIKKASEINPEEYGLFFASAGHATLFDYPKAVCLQSIASDIWGRGGVVSAVCHGPAILPKIIDKETGKSIIAGKQVTGFTTLGEEQLDLLDIIKKSGCETIEESAASVGAKYISPEHPFDDFIIAQGRLVTGANPASAKSTAAAAIAAFELALSS